MSYHSELRSTAKYQQRHNVKMLQTRYLFALTAVTQVVLLPVDTNRLRKIIILQFIHLSVTDPPAFSKRVQIPDHGPIWLHVLVSGDAVVVST